MNNFLKIFIFLLIITTVIIIVAKPEIHKRVQFEGSGFIVEEDNAMGSKTTYEYKPEVVTTTEQKKNKDEIIFVPQKQVVQTQTVEKKAEPSVKVEQKVVKTVPAIKKEVQKTPEKKVLTKQEKEVIAWNEWRSSLQNQIMRDSKITNVPFGTVFRYTFTVDKTGRVSNVKAWSEDSDYTALAAQRIKPLIQSYEGTSVLNFPSGSERVITNVSGAYKIVNSQNRFSTAKDFNDYEKK